MIRVLIVDDDKLARKGLISLVPWEECGMEVAGEAANGAKALEFLHGNRVDLAVVDLSMPVMGGLDFIEEGKKRWPELQYVVLSFHEDFQCVQAALRLGALDYISKIRLEQNDCTEVFLRVGEVLQKAAEPAVPAASAPIPPPDTAVPEARPPGQEGEWERLQREWLKLRWLYTWRAMQDLERATRALSPPPRWMEHLLVRICEAVWESFRYKPPEQVPSLGSADQGLDWLAELRRLLRDQAPGWEQSQNTAACVLRATVYVAQQPAAAFSLESVARQVNLSRSHFAASFKKAAGVTFNSFVRGEKLEAALRMLEEGRAEPQEVSYLVGYEDAKYFARLFAQQYGCSPAECRLRGTRGG